MARLYAYKCIQAEERKLQEQFENLPINGRKTTRQTIKRIKELKLDASYRLAQKCNVMVSWHKMSIQGQRVVLGEASIISGRTIVGFEKLKEIELNYKG